MSALLARMNAWPLRQRAAILEAAGYLLLAGLWLIFLPADSAGGLVFGNLAVLIPALAAFLQVLFALPQLSGSRQGAWIWLAAALAAWALRNVFWVFFGLFLRRDPPVLSLADLFGLLAYPLVGYGLFRLSRGFRNAPSGFRFSLDMLINSGAVMTLGLLFLQRAGPFVPVEAVSVIYPLADLILLMILVSLVLPGLVPVRSAILPGLAFICLGFSDYAYSFLSLSQSYHAGSITSLGWMAGYLLIGIEVLRERTASGDSEKRLLPAHDLRSPALNILPIALVLALAWYVITDWRISGQISILGGSMTLLFIVILVVRLGIRAGEVELQKYWQLFSSLAEPAFICDPQGGILLGNPALYELQAAGKDANGARESLLELFEGGGRLQRGLEEALSRVVTLEAPSRMDATPYLLTLSQVPADGRRRLVAGVAHDLTEQKRQQETIGRAYTELQRVYGRLEDLNAELEGRVEERTRTLREAYRQLEEQHHALQELDRLKTDFVSMVSHELRTPLNHLGGGIELLLGKRTLSGVEQGTLELMQSAIQRLTRFVENILDLSALEAGRLDLRLVPISPAVLVEEVMRKRTQDPESRRIRLEMPADPPLVLADENVVQSVLHHLLDNALKYAPAGAVTVQVVTRRAGVRVQVMDEGQGIPPEKRRLLFQRFQRLEAGDSQSVYGYGLGLYLSRRLLRAMRSNLSYEARPGGGSCFFFSLKAAG